MSASSAIKLTPSELQSVRAHVDNLLTSTINQARKLVEAGAVKTMTFGRDRSTLTGMVFYNDVHHTEAYFLKERLAVAHCSCRKAPDCRHTMAVLLKLLDEQTSADAPAFQVTLGGRTLTISRSGQPIPEKQASGPGLRLSAFAREVAALTSRPLSGAAAHFLRSIELWWTQKKRVVTEGDFRRALGLPDLWAREDTVLYPKEQQPASPWELLHLAAYVAAGLRLQLPSPLEDVLDPALQHRLVSAWEREKHERGWIKVLREWASRAEGDSREPAPPAVPRFRLRLTADGGLIEWQEPGATEYTPVRITPLRQWCSEVSSASASATERLRPQDRIVLQSAMTGGTNYATTTAPASNTGDFQTAVLRLLAAPDFADALVDADGSPLVQHEAPLAWDLRADANELGDYSLELRLASGGAPPRAIFVRRGSPALYITPRGVWRVASWPITGDSLVWPLVIPARALESPDGVAIIERLGVPLPSQIAARVKMLRPRISVRCVLWNGGTPSDYMHVRTEADYGPDGHVEKWYGSGWMSAPSQGGNPASPGDLIVRLDRGPLAAASEWLASGRLAMNPYLEVWERRVMKDFPEEFLAWIARRPRDLELELDANLASLRDGRVTAFVKLDVEEAGIDWFDLKVSLDVSDTTLSKEEIGLLLKSQGKWIRLPEKGWRRLDYQVSDENKEALADMGLAVSDFDGTPQRLHALQLAPAAGDAKMLSEERAIEVRRRVQEIQTRVAPPVPAGITATLRPYQEEGFHFLAYLTANHFGGVLADDMGLGKTLQTLAWLAWLRSPESAASAKAPPKKKARASSSRPPPALVVCPKSVQDNWCAEARRFLPGLKVEVWNRASAGGKIPEECDLLVIHYQQLRLHEDMLARQKWGAVILDEAQAIKNPSSQTAIAACKLRAEHRLALTGTPIENRLLDLWSIMAFAMPGVLNTRGNFTRHFDSKNDPFARRRLAARVRPFLLRRTKKEVARDLPDRIEEDLTCELEGVQERLYRAELKRARAQLLKLKTSKELDKSRFNILTSLLRLRQICCHPRLVGCVEKDAASAKLDALVELLDPLMQEGHKVLVFSQFVDMLHLIHDEVARNQWPAYILTGATDDRGPLVEQFQNHDGAAVFLISLKAGGFGLNLTAASYVVLFDPWWNPAVEAQAIDRTHRIGQQRTVIAYRLLMKDSIEEKIRRLQQQKGAIASDILGEESFAKALTLDDFKFLLGEDAST